MNVHPPSVPQLDCPRPRLSLRVKPRDPDVRRLLERTGRLATMNIEQRHVRSLERFAAVGGDMLFKTALGLLSLWLVGMVGVYNAGNLVHVPLLVGLMLLLLAFLRARDAAARRVVRGPDQS